MDPKIPDDFLERVAAKFRMLGDVTRLAILRSLMAGEKSVGRVVEETRQSQANVSKHLKLMAEAGLVARRKDGLQVFYRVRDPLIERLCALVCDDLRQESVSEMRRHSELLESLDGNGSSGS